MTRVFCQLNGCLIIILTILAAVSNSPKAHPQPDGPWACQLVGCVSVFEDGTSKSDSSCANVFGTFSLSHSGNKFIQNFDNNELPEHIFKIDEQQHWGNEIIAQGENLPATLHISKGWKNKLRWTRVFFSRKPEIVYITTGFCEGAK